MAIQKLLTWILGNSLTTSWITPAPWIRSRVSAANSASWLRRGAPTGPDGLGLPKISDGLHRLVTTWSQLSFHHLGLDGKAKWVDNWDGLTTNQIQPVPGYQLLNQPAGFGSCLCYHLMLHHPGVDVGEIETEMI